MQDYNNELAPSAKGKSSCAAFGCSEDAVALPRPLSFLRVNLCARHIKHVQSAAIVAENTLQSRSFVESAMLCEVRALAYPPAEPRPLTLLESA